nr:hypothetical protein [Ruegeria arenilitoris]
MANKIKPAQMKPEEIVSKLRQVEVLMGQGMPRLDPSNSVGKLFRDSACNRHDLLHCTGGGVL